jgi:di/tricarboxylate transporter
MAGLMGVTAFLSMWINNSAATSIMIPAAVAIVDELRTHREAAQRVEAFPNEGTRRKSKEIVPTESRGGSSDRTSTNGHGNDGYVISKTNEDSAVIELQKIPNE